MQGPRQRLTHIPYYTTLGMRRHAMPYRETNIAVNNRYSYEYLPSQAKAGQEPKLSPEQSAQVMIEWSERVIRLWRRCGSPRDQQRPLVRYGFIGGGMPRCLVG